MLRGPSPLLPRSSAQLADPCGADDQNGPRVRLIVRDLVSSMIGTRAFPFTSESAVREDTGKRSYGMLRSLKHSLLKTARRRARCKRHRSVRAEDTAYRGMSASESDDEDCRLGITYHDHHQIPRRMTLQLGLDTTRVETLCMRISFLSIAGNIAVGATCVPD